MYHRCQSYSTITKHNDTYSVARPKNARLFSFPSPYVFCCKAKNHQKIKQRLAPLFIKEYEKNKNSVDYKWSKESTSSVVTNFHTHGTHYYTQEDLNSIVWEPLDQLYKTLFDDNHPFLIANQLPVESQIEMIWWNTYDTGAYAEVHNHGFGKISGVYLLELNETNSTTFMTDDAHQFGPTESRMTHKTDYAEEGDVLLFPSSLLHCVNPTIKRRISVSFNIITKF